MKYLVPFTLWLVILCVGHADTIHYEKGGTSSEITVVKDSYREVIYQMENSAQIKISPKVVKRIDYSDAPAIFIDGKNALIQGNYEEAIRYLSEALEIAKQPPIVRDWINQYANYYIARAYHEWADRTGDIQRHKQAIAFYEKTVQLIPDTTFFYFCCLYGAQCYLKHGEYAKARENLEKLRQAVSDAKDPDLSWIFQVLFLKGHISLEEKEFTLAVSQYKEAESFAKQNNLPILRNDAVFAIGNAYISQKEFRRAQEHFEKMEKECEPENWELLASVKNGLALCYLEQGEIRKAREIAIEVFIKYPKASQQQASALFFAGQCYEKLAKQEKDSLQRAKIYYEMLRIGHPNSQWAAKASQRLYELGK